MTLAEKILAAHAGRDEVKAGEIVTVSVDLTLANDITGPVCIQEFRNMGADTVFNRERVVLVPDHFIPNKDIKSAEQARVLRDFARDQRITHYFEVGDMGIEHALLPEQGLALPGQVIIGADSHTCTYGGLGAFATGVGSTDLAAAWALGETWFRVPETICFNYWGQLQPFVSAKDLILFTIGQIGVDGALYKAMEFGGEVIAGLSVEGRLTLCNMAVEAGAKTGLVAPDATTIAYVQTRARWPYTVYQSDPDASYAAVYDFDVSGLEPQVAVPHLPSNTRNVGELGQVKIDQVLIGSCTNGRLEDLRVAARLLAGRRVHPDTRLIVIPATQAVYFAALKEGLVETFLMAGAVVSTPTCGPCLGGYMGILAAGERCLATTNRNFVGRMGHPTSEVYLASPAVAAATAVCGRITHPAEIVRNS